MIAEEKGNLTDYELLDSGDGMRLERFGQFVLARPDPAILWKKTKPEEWNKADAVFDKSGEKGSWKVKNPDLPKKWMLHYDNISFYSYLMPFKHTGVFPEQEANWKFIKSQLKGAPSALNLFGYTGIASVYMAKLGAKVTHVDASKPSITLAKENMLASGLTEDSIRWILDDALKFVRREAKRGSKYDIIILDPPAFGRGAKGEVWKFNEDLPVLLDALKEIVSDDFQFLIINAYAVSVSSILLKNLLLDFAPNKKNIDYGELVLEEKASKKLLSTGIFGRLY